MSGLLRVLMACFMCLLLMVCCVNAEELSGPPERPAVFRTPGELKQYLKALNEYFAIVGRPRFGRNIQRRSMIRSAGFGAIDAMDFDGDGMVSPTEFDFFIRSK